MMPEELLRAYNAQIARHNRMCQWLETASPEEQQKWEKQVMQVIRDCSQLVVAIERYRQMTFDEVRNGFPKVK